MPEPVSWIFTNELYETGLQGGVPIPGVKKAPTDNIHEIPAEAL